MQLKTIALATAFALTSSLAFAQAGNGNATGTQVPGTSGTVKGSGGTVGTTLDTHGRNEPGTNGMAKSGPGREPGARDRSRPGGEGVNDRPGD